jgi:hypothetical protein
LTILGVVAGLVGVWIAYATADDGSVWLATVLSAVGTAVIVVAARAGARLSGERNGSRPGESAGELGEDR